MNDDAVLKIQTPQGVKQITFGQLKKAVGEKKANAVIKYYNERTNTYMPPTNSRFSDSITDDDVENMKTETAYSNPGNSYNESRSDREWGTNEQAKKNTEDKYKKQNDQKIQAQKDREYADYLKNQENAAEANKDIKAGEEDWNKILLERRNEMIKGNVNAKQSTDVIRERALNKIGTMGTMGGTSQISLYRTDKYKPTRVGTMGVGTMGTGGYRTGGY